MPRGPVDDFVDGMERMGEMSFMDFPDDILIKVISDLDLPSRLRLRVNKRLDGLQLQVKNKFHNIYFTMSSTYYEMEICASTGTYKHELLDFNQLEQGIRRLALNSVVNDRVRVAWSDRRAGPSEQHIRIYDAFFDFKADTLIVVPPGGAMHNGFNLPHVNLSSLLTLAKNVRDVSFDCLCNSITTQDLCFLRKTMLEGGCKLGRFKMEVEEGTYKSFVEDCFGVTIEEFLGRRMYRTADQSVEIYSYSTVITSHDILNQLEGDLLTRIRGSMFNPSYQIAFGKGCHNIPARYQKIMLNRPLTIEEDTDATVVCLFVDDY